MNKIQLCKDDILEDAVRITGPYSSDPHSSGHGYANGEGDGNGYGSEKAWTNGDGGKGVK